MTKVEGKKDTIDMQNESQQLIFEEIKQDNHQKKADFIEDYGAGTHLPRHLPLSAYSKLTDIPGPTLKRYALNHSDYIDVRKVGTEYRISYDSLDVIKFIRECYQSGKKRLAVNEALEASNFHPILIDTQLEKQQQQHSNVSNEVLAAILQELKEIHQELAVQTSLNHDLQEEMAVIKNSYAAALEYNLQGQLSKDVQQPSEAIEEEKEDNTPIEDTEAVEDQEKVDFDPTALNMWQRLRYVFTGKVK